MLRSAYRPSLPYDGGNPPKRPQPGSCCWDCDRGQSRASLDSERELVKMAAAKRAKASELNQQTILFTRKSKRSQRSDFQKLDGKVGKTASKLAPRVQRTDAEKKDANADEILNGAESKALLDEMRQDRFSFPRFHQEDMPIAQQLLRQFDMIQEYGPSQGITRLQRWNRAQKLGKNPPLQIKAVLDAAKTTPEYAREYEMSVFGKLG